jgi:ankyrin repeat protein
MRRWSIIIGLPITAVLCVAAILFPVCRGRLNSSKIIQAVKQNDVAAVESLLDKGVNVNTKNSYGEPLLILSIRNKYKEITRLLIEKGADVNIKQDISTSTFKVPPYGRQEAQSAGGLSALHWAVNTDDMALIETLLAKKANIDSVDALGHTPLHYAVINGQTEIIKLLLFKGSNANIKDHKWGHTPLHNAVTFCQICKPEIIYMLLEHGADIDAVDKKGMTPIQYVSNQPETVKLLISKGANVNIQNASGATLLHSASGRGDSDLVKILLSNGAKPNIRDNNGKTPLDIAIQKKYTDIANVIKTHGGKRCDELGEAK